MKFWPWSKRAPEKRESLPFTDAVVAALTAQAAGTATGDPSQVAALEAATAAYASAFAAATVTPAEARAVLTPPTMALLARNLIRRGESVHRIVVERGEVRLQAAGSWDVRGGPREAGWWYRIDSFGPSGNTTHFIPGAAVLHVRYAVDPGRPWHGIAPLAWARATGSLAANLETRLGEEAGGPVGHVIPYPTGPDDPDDEDDPLTMLRSDLARAKGGTILAETLASGGGEGRGAAPMADWKSVRFGANPPDALPSLRIQAAESVLSACGVPISLVTAADGTAQRESWRRFVMGSVAPLLAIVAEEAERKLDVANIEFDLTGLYAHDLQGRASAFQKLVAGGVSVNEALATSGLLALAEDGQ